MPARKPKHRYSVYSLDPTTGSYYMRYASTVNNFDSAVRLVTSLAATDRIAGRRPRFYWVHESSGFGWAEVVPVFAEIPHGDIHA